MVTSVVMSRQTKFTMKFPKGGLTVKIAIQKSSEGKTSLRQTYVDDAGENREVRTVKVLAKDDVKPTSVADIEQVIPWNQVQSSFPYHDEDTDCEILLPLDEKTRCQVFSKSEYMNGVGFVNKCKITPNMYAGDHYFVKVQPEGKSKKCAAGDVQGYSLLYFTLSQHDKMFIVKFISGDREKYGVLYPVGDSLMMSTIIHHNYQRSAPLVPKVALPKAKEHSHKMLSAFEIPTFMPAMTKDRYEDTLIGYIEELKRISKGGKVKMKVKTKNLVSYDEDFFSQLDAFTC
jgi:hypothetical protein